MDSPQPGDVTTASIANRLSDTHLHVPSVEALISAAVYGGHKTIQLNVAYPRSDTPPAKPQVVLRRVQDLYVNISQLLHVLVQLGLFTESQLNNYLDNEIVQSARYDGATVRYDDFRHHDVPALRGLWIPYDKSVSLALKFDIYEFVKKLFLVDVHDFDSLPRASGPSGQKRSLLDDGADLDSSSSSGNASLMGSPTKRQKTIKREQKPVSDTQNSNADLLRSVDLHNSNYPYTLPPVASSNSDLVSEIKLKFSEVFKLDDNSSKVTHAEIKALFQSTIDDHKNLTSLVDIPLDALGKTALHFAATLASTNLVASFVNLGLSSAIRGTSSGESALISAIQVTNCMEKGNFTEVLANLWPNLWLYDSNKQSFLHHLVRLAVKNAKSAQFYFTKIIEWVVASKNKNKFLYRLTHDVINAQDDEHGNTALHFAAENELRWFTEILLELNADVNSTNKQGVKPLDFDIVKEILSDKENKSRQKLSDDDEYIFEVVRTSVEFLKKRIEISGPDSIKDEEQTEPAKGTIEPVKDNPTAPYSSNKIFQSIQDLLASTNKEYETIINEKKAQIASLNKELHDSTIVTANNRYVAKKISEKLADLDTMKLQMANISERIQELKREEPLAHENDDSGDEYLYFDADEPFMIKSIYEKVSNGEEVIELDPEVAATLPLKAVLNARISAYKEVNSTIQQSLARLADYSELTSKFKKVVSFCTGVDINEVDELLDGLLEAVEGQQ